MLDVGISSTRHMLRFWGLVPQVTVRADVSRTIRHPVRSTRRSAPRLSQTVNVADKVTKTIEDALRAAGLFR